MQWRKSAIIAIALGLLLLQEAPSIASNPFALEQASLHAQSNFTAPQSNIPGPGWFADDHLAAPNGPPSDNGWQVSYPFKYYPQGELSAGEYGYGTCFLPPDAVDECFCSPPPCYFGTFYFEVLALDRRSNLEPMDLYFNNANAAVLNTSDFNFDTEAGIRIGFLLASACGNDWTGEYFGINSYQDSITRSDAAGVTDLFFGRVGGPLPSLTAEYESKLDSLEFSVRSRQTRRIAPLAGIRYVSIDESFNSMQDPVVRQGWFSDSQNDMFGFQFGLQGLIFEMGRWRMETTAKAGPYVNDIDVDVRIDPTNPATGLKHVNHWHTSFVGDLRLGLNCRLGARMNFRVGYQALWIEGIALAPNQNNNISFATNRESIDLGGVIYQGGYLGLDLSW